MSVTALQLDRVLQSAVHIGMHMEIAALSAARHTHQLHCEPPPRPASVPPARVSVARELASLSRNSSTAAAAEKHAPYPKAWAPAQRRSQRVTESGP